MDAVEEVLDKMEEALVKVELLFEKVDEPAREITEVVEETMDELLMEVTKEADDEDEEEDEEEEEKLPPGTLERPLIVEGKRSRTAAEAFKMDSPASLRKRKQDYMGGSGTALVTDSHFVDVTTKKKVFELRPIHRLLYGTDGTQRTRRHEIRRFSGYTFDENSADFDRCHRKLLSFQPTDFALIKSAFKNYYSWSKDDSKSEYATQLLRVLLNPPDMSASSEAAKKTPSTPKTPRGRKRSSPPTSASGPKAKRGRRPKQAVEDEEEENISDEEEKAEEDSDDEVIPEPSSSRRKKLPPTNEELDLACRELIKDADLNTLTTKDVMRLLQDKFPQLNTTKRREDIKKIIRDIAIEHA